MNVMLRIFEFKDIPNKVRWINDPGNNKYLHYDFPLDIDKTGAWFDKHKDATDRYDAVIEYSGIPVGVIGLLNVQNGRAEYYITIGEQKYKGRGIAKEATSLLLDFAFHRMSLSEIYLYTEVDNIAAQKLFEKCGFRKIRRENNSALNRGVPVDRFYYVAEKGTWRTTDDTN